MDPNGLAKSILFGVEFGIVQTGEIKPGRGASHRWSFKWELMITSVVLGRK